MSCTDFMRRSEAKLSELVTCSHCGRACRRELATRAGGQWYGSECRVHALAVAEDAERLSRGELD